MKVTKVKSKVDVLAEMIKAEHSGMKITEAYQIANGILNNWILCNGLNKALPYGSDDYLSNNCDI
jgi:hypothetical protein